MTLTLSGTNGVVGAGFTLDPSGTSVTSGIGTFSKIAVGANNVNPTQALEVKGSSSVAIQVESSAAQYSEVQINNSTRNYTLGVRPDISHGFAIRDASAGANRFTIDTSGNATLTSGNLVIGTAGKGIAFSVQTPTSATGATTTAEVLDHYEEGTFTPIISDGSSNSTFGGITAATYTKIGNIVRASFRCVNAQTSGLTATNTFYVKGLPFSTVNRNYSTAWLRTFDSSEWSAAKCLVFAYIESNHIYFQGDDGTSAGKTLEVRDVTNNSGDMFMTMVYETTD